MQKDFTPEELEAGREYMRERCRAYWNRLPENERKARRKDAYNRFWSKMSKEERKQKRLEYAAATAARKAAKFTTDSEG